MKGFSQSTEYTTAAAGLTAIIHHFNKSFSLTANNELNIWKETVTLPTRASSIFGLANFAKEQGLSPKILVENCEYDYPDYRFKRYTKTDIELAKKMHELYVATTKKLNIPIEEKEILFSTVKKLIIEKNILLIRLNEGALRDTGSTSKYVVVYGCKDDAFLVLDPMQEKPLISVSEKKLQESFETLTSKKKRDHRIIVFS